MDPTHASEPTDPFIATIQSRGFRVLERLGETPAGLVYRAQYFSSGPPVVVVLLNAAAGPRPRFATPRPPPEMLEQLQHASRIRHPNVAGVREIGETTEGLVYAVLDAVPGDVLYDVVTTRGTLPPHEAVDLTLQAAAGLRAAHAAGVVHGNLSPDTVVVAEGSDGHALVKLVGFATASMNLGAWGPGSSVEPGAFASPEQAAGGVPDKRGDVYGLAAVLYYMLTGEPPRKGAIPRSVPKGLRSVLRDALATSAADRFETVDQFGEAVQEAMSRLPAGDVSARRVAAIGARLVVIALLTGLGWFLVPKVGPKLAGLRDLARKESVSRWGGRHDVVPSASQTRRPPPGDSVLETADAPKRHQPEGDALRGSDAGGTSGDETPPATSSAPPTRGSSRGAARGSRAEPPTGVALSPFRRAHPWAALPEGRYYFRSSCSLALEAPELIYFRTEEQAQATGREKSTVQGCF
jgi:serine/threonine protein kinase